MSKKHQAQADKYKLLKKFFKKQRVRKKGAKSVRYK